MRNPVYGKASGTPQRLGRATPEFHTPHEFEPSLSPGGHVAALQHIDTLLAVQRGSRSRSSSLSPTARDNLELEAAAHIYQLSQRNDELAAELKHAEAQLLNEQHGWDVLVESPESEDRVSRSSSPHRRDGLEKSQFYEVPLSGTDKQAGYSQGAPSNAPVMRSHRHHFATVESAPTMGSGKFGSSRLTCKVCRVSPTCK